MQIRKIALAFALLAAAASPVSSLRAEDFSGDRMRAGKDAWRARRYPEAADQFRIASFGFLDDPRRLLESLARLALAQAAARPPADVAPTVGRLLDVERRFGVFATADLEPDVRTEIGKLLVARVPAATLAEIPGFSGLVETAEQKIAKLPPKERAKALESAARAEPGAVRWPLALCRLALETGDPRSLERWSERALEIAPGDREALAFRAHARVARSKCADALSDLRALSPADFERWPALRADDFVCRAANNDWAGAAEALERVPAAEAARRDVVLAKTRLERQQTAERSQGAGLATSAPAGGTPSPATKGPEAPSRASAATPGPSPAPGADLSAVRRLLAAGKPADAEALVRRLVEAEPSRRDYRLALLEAACLARDFRAAADQIARLLPFGEGEAPFEFYSAVVLYETGRVADARRYLERARPRIVATSYTDYYARKILGS